MKSWVRDDLINFGGAADGLLCARDHRTSRRGCSGGPVSRKWRISPVVQSTTRPKWLESVSGTRYVELDKLPESNSAKSKRSPKRLLVEFRFCSLYVNQMSKWLIDYSLLDQPNANQIKRLKRWRSRMTKKNVEMGP